ncbi:MAG: hypothetical protein AAB875_03220 [Patescibacteria group bacterium]
MTIKNSIIRFLEEQGGLQFAGKIANAVSEIHFCKPSNCERRMRELENEGKITRELVDNPAGGNKVVAYRLSTNKPIVYNPMHYRPEILKAKLISESQKSLL